MSDPVTVTVINNGPLKISGDGMSIRFCGKPVEVEGTDVYLCRCGQSKNAPFCDGGHSKSGFVGESPARPQKDVHVWEGKTIRTFFNPNACMHVFHCKPLKELRQRELAGDSSAAEEIAKVVLSCPSGALSYEATEVNCEAPEGAADVEIMEGGEVRLQCRFEINAELQERQTPDRATLCRCGLSKNKPWCDGQHKKHTDFR